MSDGAKTTSRTHKLTIHHLFTTHNTVQLFIPSLKEFVCFMYPVILTVLFGLCCFYSCAQQAQRLMIGVQTDLIKSDNDGFFEKLQGGLEANYYFSRKFSATAGLELWTEDKVSLVAGVRFSPIDEAFIRMRGLPGNDFSLGVGFAKPLSEKIRLEAMADVYLEGHIAIRAGIAFGIGTLAN
jgi:hypothetical protein